MQRASLSVLLALHEQPALDPAAAEEIVSHFLSGCVDLLKRPQARLSLYLSGMWFELAKQRRSTLLKELRRATEEGRVEWIGGGWHDPVLPFVPRPLQELEIRLHRQAVEKLMGVRPRGFWLPSGVWESGLLSLLAEQGFEYTFLYDYQIDEAAWRCTDRYGYRTVEDCGRILRVVQMESGLESALCAGDEAKFDEALRASQTDEGDDGYALVAVPFLRSGRGVYERGLFDRLAALFDRGAKSAGQTVFKLASDQIDERRSAGGMNLVSSVDRSFGIDRSLKSCRDLLLMQPESNEIQKRMLQLWRQITHLPAGRTRQAITEKLLPVTSVYWYRNDPAAGGIRFLEDRARCRRILMEVEQQLRRARSVEGASIEAMDVLGTGTPQIYCSGQNFSFLAEPGFGGRLRSLENHPRKVSLIDGFHPARTVGDVGLHYAVAPVCGFRDWIAPENFGDAETWIGYLADDAGLMQGPMEHQYRMRRDGAQIVFSGNQWCELKDRRRTVHVEKAFSLKNDGDALVVAVQISNPDFYLLRGCYLCELNLSFSKWAPGPQKLLAGDAEIPLGGATLTDGVESVEYRDDDEKTRVVWSFVKPCRLLSFPMSTPGPDGGPQHFQCLKLFAVWDLELMGQGKLGLSSSLKVKKSGLFG